MWNAEILEEAKKAWETWNLRGFMLLSLSLQVILIFAAPLRKRTSFTPLLFLVWLAYLLADWVAAFTVGLIAKSQYSKYEVASPASFLPNQQLLALWASFLLVHLGGPDTITAYALEDNALWPRHLLGLLFQVASSLYILYETFSWHQLLPTTILILSAGIIKYTERTRALFLGCLANFKEYNMEKPDPGPNYEKLMNAFSWQKRAMLPVRIRMFGGTDTKAETDEYTEGTDLSKCSKVIKHAVYFFQIYKGAIVDLIFSFHDRSQSQRFFKQNKDTFKVIAVELNLLYDVLYTKAMIFNSAWAYFFRIMAFMDVVMATVFFQLANKDQFHPSDVKITYCLLLGAITLDGVAVVMSVFSDWCVNSMMKLQEMKSSGSVCFYQSVGQVVISLVDFLKRPATCSCKFRPDMEEFKLSDTNILFRRWSETISAYNLLNHCLREKPRKIRKPMSWWWIIMGGILGSPLLVIWPIRSLFGCISHASVSCLHLRKVNKMISKWLKLDRLLEALDRMKFTSSVPHIEELWEKIFAELVAKVEHADSDTMMAKKIFQSRGEWVLQNLISENYCTNMTKYMHNFDYDQSLLMWHIATELNYNTYIEKSSRDEICLQEFSKILSDYMMYLLIGQPKLMSAVVGLGQIRYRDTCAEVKRFFEDGARVTRSGGGDTQKDASAWAKVKIFFSGWVTGGVDTQKDASACAKVKRFFSGGVTGGGDMQKDASAWAKVKLFFLGGVMGGGDTQKDASAWAKVKIFFLGGVTGGGDTQKDASACAKVKRFFEGGVTGGGDKLKYASDRLLEVDTSINPSEIKGDKCKSVLFDACILAKELRKNEHQMWEITFKVWVELLSYAASHCRADGHAQALSRGGELVSFVWLLLIQLGIGERFHKNKGFGKVKLSSVM